MPAAAAADVSVPALDQRGYALSARLVALIAKVFFHNGQMKSLRDVIRFYNTRDTNPELWSPVPARSRRSTACRTAAVPPAPRLVLQLRPAR